MNLTSPTLKWYSRREERLNILTHGIGLLLSIAALPLLIVQAALDGTAWHVTSFSIFGASLIILYTASTIYHRARNPTVRHRLKVVDHAAIFVLIAGTYTPFTLVTLNGSVGWVLFGIIWGLALIGVTLKLFYTGRFRILSTLMYVLMGWAIIFAIRPLEQNLPVQGLIWLLSGGVAYTVGALLYGLKRVPFNHAIFHLLVLVGSFTHFWTVMVYV